MAQLHCYVPEEIADRAQRRAKQSGLSLSRYLRNWSSATPVLRPGGRKAISTCSGNGKGRHWRALRNCPWKSGSIWNDLPARHQCLHSIAQ